jgi:hypothetical protein
VFRQFDAARLAQDLTRRQKWPPHPGVWGWVSGMGRSRKGLIDRRYVCDSGFFAARPNVIAETKPTPGGGFSFSLFGAKPGASPTRKVECAVAISMEEGDCAARAKRPSSGLFRNLEDAGFRSFDRVS